MQLNGIILKGIGGFYYVETDSGVFECKAKGKFRKQKLVPVSGDNVLITVNELAENTIDEIKPRKNILRRPPVANIDRLFIVVSTTEPVPNTLVTDRLTVLSERLNIEPVIVVSKTDIKSGNELFDIYEKTPYTVVENTDTEKILSLIEGKLCAFTGNSGVGKSTLLNHLCPSLELPTNEISDKLGRGRHTTRQAEIFHIGGGMAIDTAGFSSLEFEGREVILKNELELYFPEFEDCLGKCKFTGCAHINDKGCAVAEKIKAGGISKSRHESYVFMYNEAKNINEWELRK